MAVNGNGKVQGTSSKYDKGLSVLEQYELVSEKTCRGRGTLLCQTSQGLVMIQPYAGSVRRLEKINQILLHLQNLGCENLDVILENKEGALVSEDKDGNTYLVKKWWEAKESSVRQESDLLACMEKLASIHKNLQKAEFDAGDCERESILQDYERHSSQLRKIRTYIRKRKQKNCFEYQYLSSVDRYLKYAKTAIKELKDCSLENAEMNLCHGMCNQHNFLMTEKGTALVNFDHFFMGNQMTDVAQFVRKIMEKHNWNTALARRMLAAYDTVLPISEEQWKYLGIRLAFPEKYWKVANQYYNNKKSFLPEKNIEKLQTVIRQEKRWLDFLEELFDISC